MTSGETESRQMQKSGDTLRRGGGPWLWVPTLYLAEGLPYALVINVAVVFYKNFGVSNAGIAFYTGWFYLPWVIKGLWGPVVDLVGTRRRWIWVMQLCLGAAFAGVALAIPTTHFFQLTLAWFWLIAFSSATHDIAADGFYILANSERQQSAFSGVRNTFYRVAMIVAQGQLVVLVGRIHDRTGSFVAAWTSAFALVAGTILLFSAYHRWILPRPAGDLARRAGVRGRLMENFLKTFAAFFRKPQIGLLIAFLLLYRFGEAQLLTVAKFFLLDPRDHGGLALSDEQYGWIYGNVGIGALLIGGLSGGFVISRQGLKFWFWPMLLAIHLPDAVFIWLAWAQPTDLRAIGAGVAIEQFGYGFGFTAFMLYMIYIARGEHATAHYAICTGFMALGMMVPGMWSGWLQQHLGYPHFFIWVILATIPSFLIVARIPLDYDFGKRSASA